MSASAASTVSAASLPRRRLRSGRGRGGRRRWVCCGLVPCLRLLVCGGSGHGQAEVRGQEQGGEPERLLEERSVTALAARSAGFSAGSAEAALRLRRGCLSFFSGLGAGGSGCRGGRLCAGGAGAVPSGRRGLRLLLGGFLDGGRMFIRGNATGAPAAELPAQRHAARRGGPAPSWRARIRAAGASAAATGASTARVRSACRPAPWRLRVRRGGCLGRGLSGGGSSPGRRRASWPQAQFTLHAAGPDG